ncbi:MAG: zinc ribbon domain-containing protein [Chloroflexi bacterium]|nr:zinc ribbon domain-containing protein [Chloroflexota bacterium]
MFLMWIVPLLLIGLMIHAISGNNFNALKPAAVASRACPNCNQAVQDDWKTCPHCGQTL